MPKLSPETSGCRRGAGVPLAGCWGYPGQTLGVGWGTPWLLAGVRRFGGWGKVRLPHPRPPPCGYGEVRPRRRLQFN
mgnify:CR=1 FL=1